MYIPKSYVVDEQESLLQFIHKNSFATMVSSDDQEPVATHLPLLLNTEEGPHGTLVGHMAKANSQWKSAQDQKVLCIFNGPHSYISPTWYEATNVVPTWNYVAVHAYGTMTRETQPEKLVQIVRQYVERYEAAMPTPWEIDSVDTAFVKKLTEGIVGFSIEIRRLEGQWKLSQNHSVERRKSVIDGLRRRDEGDDVAVAKLMDAMLPD